MKVGMRVGQLAALKAAWRVGRKVDEMGEPMVGLLVDVTDST